MFAQLDSTLWFSHNNIDVSFYQAGVVSAGPLYLAVSLSRRAKTPPHSGFASVRGKGCRWSSRCPDVKERLCRSWHNRKHLKLFFHFLTANRRRIDRVYLTFYSAESVSASRTLSRLRDSRRSAACVVAKACAAFINTMWNVSLCHSTSSPMDSHV